MPDFLQGFLQTQQAGVEAINDVTVAIRNWYANRNPLYTRSRHVPVDRVDFTMYTHKYRSRSTTLGSTAITDTTATTLTLADVTFLMMHDVLEVKDETTGVIERMQITADPTVTDTTTGAGTIVVTRGVSSTTKATNISATTGVVNLIGGSRTGSEINQSGLATKGAGRTQYCQTFQNPVQVGGSAQTTGAMVLPGGIASPFDFNKTMQLQNMVDDIEVSMYVGKADAPVDGSVTAKMNGLKYILTTNNVTAPTNAAAYKPSDLIRDALQSARTNGGEPDLLFVTTDFMSGMATWGMAVQRIPAGETAFGTPINLFECPFLNGIAIIEAPLLGTGRCFALTSEEVYIRPKRNVYWNPRGNRGDAIEGEWIGELAIEVVNESHHAWVEGITAFSAT